MVAALGNSKDYTLKQYLVFADKLQNKARVCFIFSFLIWFMFISFVLDGKCTNAVPLLGFQWSTVWLGHMYLWIEIELDHKNGTASFFFWIVRSNNSRIQSDFIYQVQPDPLIEFVLSIILLSECSKIQKFVSISLVAWTINDWEECGFSFKDVAGN